MVHRETAVDGDRGRSSMDQVVIDALHATDTTSGGKRPVLIVGMRDTNLRRVEPDAHRSGAGETQDEPPRIVGPCTDAGNGRSCVRDWLPSHAVLNGPITRDAPRAVHEQIATVGPVLEGRIADPLAVNIQELLARG